MNVSRLVTSGLLFVVALGPRVARGQDSATIHVNVHVPDSVAHIVDRERPDHARFAIVSTDGQAQLLLMDTTIVAQMTDRGLAHVSSHEATDTIKSAASRIFRFMVPSSKGYAASLSAPDEPENEGDDRPRPSLTIHGQ